MQKADADHACRNARLMKKSGTPTAVKTATGERACVFTN